MPRIARSSVLSLLFKHCNFTLSDREFATILATHLVSGAQQRTGNCVLWALRPIVQRLVTEHRQCFPASVPSPALSANGRYFPSRYDLKMHCLMVEDQVIHSLLLESICIAVVTRPPIARSSSPHQLESEEKSVPGSVVTIPSLEDLCVLRLALLTLHDADGDIKSVISECLPDHIAQSILDCPFSTNTPCATPSILQRIRTQEGVSVSDMQSFLGFRRLVRRSCPLALRLEAMFRFGILCLVHPQAEISFLLTYAKEPARLVNCLLGLRGGFVNSTNDVSFSQCSQRCQSHVTQRNH